MSIQKNNFYNNRRIGNKPTNHIVGLDSFRRRLEKDFYAEVYISDYGLNEEEASLCIEIKCNLSLSESLYFLENPDSLSTTTQNLNSRKTLLFTKAYSDLRRKNNISLDIKELNIVLTDTTIFISKVYEQSIYQQLENIATELALHHIYYTKGLSENPYEIFIPVFEANDLTPGIGAINHPLRDSNIPSDDYALYWGVYYDHTEEAAIYDLQSQKLIKGDIQIFT
ncbi:hypothetical protein [Arenibacter certesii]|uniref:Uncharacterized protein n=1 Tax=Arenibacter certesii TaxID=228955 RepID=A0A918J270_9FLAO|nr:hypothetical protein [Arenibacter certesii]GGW43341.1 hypothetical protein GCM10007383_29930 [Arenibacter certesii]